MATAVPEPDVEPFRQLGRDRAHSGRRQRGWPVGERAQDEVEEPARRREPFLEKHAAQERREEVLDGRARDAGAAKGLGRRRLGARAAQKPHDCSPVADADDSPGESTQTAHRRVPRVGDPSEAPARADDRSTLEHPEGEAIVVERAPGLGIGDGKDLETVVELEPLDDIRPDPSSDGVRALEHEGSSSTRKERTGARETGRSSADDDDVVLFAHAASVPPLQRRR